MLSERVIQEQKGKMKYCFANERKNTILASFVFITVVAQIEWWDSASATYFLRLSVSMNLDTPTM